MTTLTDYIEAGLLVPKGSYYETGCKTAVVWYDPDMRRPWRWAFKPGRAPASGPDHGGSGTLRICLWAIATVAP